MSESYEFDSVEHFTVGAVGPKGQRVFMIQARRGSAMVTLRLEKQQVAALADRLEQLANDLVGASNPDPSSANEIDEAQAPLWIVGALAVGVEVPDRIVVLAEELVRDDDVDDIDDIDASSASFRLEAGQVTAFIARAREVIAAGRPPCPYCGSPLESGGEFCPCWN